MPDSNLCVWCIKPKSVHLSNGHMANLCEECVADIQRRAPAVSRDKWFADNERRPRPMPAPFPQAPKLPEFEHGGNTND